MTWLSLPSFWKPATEHRRGISTAYRCAKSRTVHAAKPSCPIGASASPSCAFPRQRCLPSPWPAFHHRPTRSPRFGCGATDRGGIRWGGRSGRIPAPASSGTPSAARRPAAAVATGRPAAVPRSAGNSLFRFGPDQPPGSPARAFCSAQDAAFSCADGPGAGRPIPGHPHGLLTVVRHPASRAPLRIGSTAGEIGRSPAP